MATSLKPKPRPANLPLMRDYPNDPPITVPTDTSTDESVFEWCESLRDHYQQQGSRLSPVGLLKIADVAGLDPTETSALKKKIKTIYADELKDKPKAAKSAKPPTKPSTTKGGAKVTATKSAPKKAAKPATKAAKPSKNGVHGGESTVIYSAKVRGVPVEVRKSPEGKFLATFFSYPIRKIMQWMGAEKWLTGEAEIACNKLLSGCKTISAEVGGKVSKGGEAYVRALLNEGHLGSGRNAAKKGGKGCFGKFPKLEKAEAAAINSLRK